MCKVDDVSYWEYPIVNNSRTLFRLHFTRFLYLLEVTLYVRFLLKERYYDSYALYIKL